MADQATPETTAAETQEIVVDAALLASIADNPEKLKEISDANPGVLEKIQYALTHGDVTDEDLQAARDAAATPASPPTTPAAVVHQQQPAVREDAGSRLARERENLESAKTRKTEYATKRAELETKIVEIKTKLARPAPSKDDYEAYETWRDEQMKLLGERSELVGQKAELASDYAASRETEYITRTERKITESSSRIASNSIESVIASDPIFKTNLKLEVPIDDLQNNVYDPWMAKLVTANGGKVTHTARGIAINPADIQAAWTRFKSDPAWAATPELKAPENLESIFVILNARQLVSKGGRTPRAALIEAAEKNGYYENWMKNSDNAREADIQERIKNLGNKTAAVLERRNTEPRSAPLGPGRGSPRSGGRPTDVASAKAQLEVYFNRKENGPAFTARELEIHSDYNTTAFQIIEAAKARGEQVD